MALIEGIGDEVLIFVVIVALVGLVLIAWASTWVRPMFNNGSVWMVHMQTAPERRVLEVYSLDESAATNRQPPSTRPLVTNTIPSPSNGNDAESSATTSASAAEESDDNSERQQLEPSANPDQPIDCERTCSESARRRIVMATTTDQQDGTTTETNVEVVDGSEDMQSTSADTTTIKLKFLDDTQKLVATWLSQTVGEFKRQHFETDVSQGKVVRLIYRGQLLRDDSRSLASYGLHDNCVLHCHVSTTPYEQQSATARRASRPGDGSQRTSASASGINAGSNAGHGLDLGRYIYVIFACNFAALWSAWFVFPEYFSRTSLVSLILCSGLFMLFWYGSQRRRPAAGEASVGNTNAVS